MESYWTRIWLQLSAACGQCGSLTGVLSKLPAQSIPFSLVRSRYTPNTSDLPVIQGLISSSEVAIRLLEAELSQLQSRLSNIYTFKTFQGSLLAPIRRLPDELLGEIFAHAVGREGIDIGDKDSQIWDLWRVVHDGAT
ncbi:hypothetical protein BDQ17DRAFT_1280433 [Cyathus striatus]|nr:hypothetical protein BDQ17DRAFT_1280433 [Cyathus striatus]